MSNSNPTSHKPKAYKHAPLAVVHVKWERTSSRDILRLWPKSYLIGVVNTKLNCWMVNNLLTGEHARGISKTSERARALVVSHLVAMGKNTA